jgi:hypothetical protein
MTVNEILQRIGEKLGTFEFYTQAEMIANGLNPAQRLLCLLTPEALTQRTTITLAANEIFVDLRQSAINSWQIRRVILGTITGEDATRSNGEFRDILPASLGWMSGRRDWFTKTGAVQRYARHGRFWLVFYRRPVQSETLTLIYRAVPTAFTTASLASTPDVQSSYHPLLADIATALLLIKEGVTESDKAVRMLSEIFGTEHFEPLRKALDRMQRQSARNEVAGAVS